MIAYRNGFVGSVYGVDASQNTSKGLIFVGSGQAIADVDLRLSPVPDITTLSREMLGSAVPGQQTRFAFGPGSFSPDGKQFAFGATSPGAEQVCVYNLVSRRLKCDSGRGDNRHRRAL